MFSTSPGTPTRFVERMAVDVSDQTFHQAFFTSYVEGAEARGGRRPHQRERGVGHHQHEPQQRAGPGRAHQAQPGPPPRGDARLRRRRRRPRTSARPSTGPVRGSSAWSAGRCSFPPSGAGASSSSPRASWPWRRRTTPPPRPPPPRRTCASSVTLRVLTSYLWHQWPRQLKLKLWETPRAPAGKSPKPSDVAIAVERARRARRQPPAPRGRA